MVKICCWLLTEDVFAKVLTMIKDCNGISVEHLMGVTDIGIEKIRNEEKVFLQRMWKRNIYYRK